MPVVDRREFGGRFSVSENSKRLSNYRYLEIQLMEMIGGWCHTTPPLALKAAFGYHVYDHARNADMLAERLQQLRSGREREDPANDDFAHLCEHVWNLESTVDRLVAVYRGLEPHLVSTFVYHADATDPLADTPTVRVLHQLAGTDQSHIAWGQAVLDSLTQDPAEHRARYGEDQQPTLEGFRARFHQLLYGEVETTDRMGKMLAEFPELPWEMRMELAHQMWDEARHIEIVAKAVEEECGGQLGYGPWTLLWWWMQNEEDPLKRITVTNSWAEANLMNTLKQWRTEAEKRGYTRIAELADYLQADERTHVRLATDWIQKLTDDDTAHRDELVRWGREAIAHIQGFHASRYKEMPDPEEARFTFLKPNSHVDAGMVSPIIGEERRDGETSRRIVATGEGGRRGGGLST